MWSSLCAVWPVGDAGGDTRRPSLTGRSTRATPGPGFCPRRWAVNAPGQASPPCWPCSLNLNDFRNSFLYNLKISWILFSHPEINHFFLMSRKLNEKHLRTAWGHSVIKMCLKVHLKSSSKSGGLGMGGDCKGPEGTFLGGGDHTQVCNLPKLKVN